MEAIAASNIKTTVYFYNPNIHPIDEYEIRKDENRRFCEKLDLNVLMETMIKIIGLRESKVLKMNQKEVRDVQNALI